MELNNIKERILERVELLTNNSLNARNFIKGINEYTISSLNYYTGIVIIGEKERND